MLKISMANRFQFRIMTEFSGLFGMRRKGRDSLYWRCGNITGAIYKRRREKSDRKVRQQPGPGSKKPFDRT